MSSPPGRAALAAVAALFILVSLATTAWWSGSLAGSERRSASIGLLGGVGCNKIGEKTCQSISLTKASGAFGALGMATFAFGVAAAVGSLGLGLFGLRRDPKERKLAPITLGAAAASVLMAIGFIVTKPKFINVPVSYGLYLGMLGFVAAAGRALLGLSAAPNRNAMQFHQAGMQGGYLHAAPQAFDPANPFGSPSSGQPASPSSQPPPGFGPPPSQPPGFGPPASQPPPGFGPPPSQPPPGFGPPSSQPPGFGPQSSQPPPGFGPPPGHPSSQPPPGFGPPASQPPPGFGPPASQPPPGFGPPASQPPPGFGPPPGQPPSQPPGFGPPPTAQPPLQPPPGFGQPPTAQPPLQPPPGFGQPPAVQPPIAAAVPGGGPRTVIPVPSLGGNSPIASLPPVTRSKPDLTKPPPRRAGATAAPPLPTSAPPPVTPSVKRAEAPPVITPTAKPVEPVTAPDVAAIEKPDFATVAMQAFVDEPSEVSPDTLPPEDEYTQSNERFVPEETEFTTAEPVAATRQPSPACPTCNSPMDYVAVHSRYFCNACRTYY